MRHTDAHDPWLEDQTTVHYFPADDGSESLITRIVRALADIEETSPETFDSGLHRVVDLDALERLFKESPDNAGKIVLQLDGTMISINSDGSFVLLT